MPDLETFLIAASAIIDNIYEETLASLVRNRNGPQLTLSDSELVTPDLMFE